MKTETKFVMPHAKALPNINNAAKMILDRLKQRWAILGGACPITDFELAKVDAWVVGSTVWRPAILGVHSLDSDLDLVFGDTNSRDITCMHVRRYSQQLDARWDEHGDGYYHAQCRRFKQHGTDRTLIDLRCPPSGVTVEENVLSFNETYRRVAYHVPTGRLFRGVLRCTAPSEGGISEVIQ